MVVDGGDGSSEDDVEDGGGGSSEVDVGGGGGSDVDSGGSGTDGVDDGTSSPALVSFDMTNIWRLSRGKFLYEIGMLVVNCAAWHNRMRYNTLEEGVQEGKGHFIHCTYNGDANQPTSRCSAKRMSAAVSCFKERQAVSNY